MSARNDPQQLRAAVAGLASIIVATNAYRMAAAAHFGLDLVDTHAIGYLDSYGPMSQSQLARLMGLSSGALTGIVDRLERAGTARRSQDPDDRRRHRVELTDRSGQMLEESNAVLGRIFDEFDPDVLAVLVEALPDIAAGMDREARVMGELPAASESTPGR